MSNTINSKYGKASIKAIEEFERKIGVGLPFEYRTFLLENNGGKPERENFEIDGMACAVCLFFPLGQTPPNDLLYMASYMGDDVPENLLPIARDYMGNLICLGVKGKNSGKLYFWDHDLGPQDCKLIKATGFNNFLENLK